MPRRIEVKIRVDVFENRTPLLSNVADNFFDERPQSETSSTSSDERPSLPFAAPLTSRFSTTIHNGNVMDDQNIDNNETSNDLLLCKILQDKYDGEYAAFLENKQSNRVIEKGVRMSLKKDHSSEMKQLKDALKDACNKCDKQKKLLEEAKDELDKQKKLLEDAKDKLDRARNCSICYEHEKKLCSFLACTF